LYTTILKKAKNIKTNIQFEIRVEKIASALATLVAKQKKTEILRSKVWKLLFAFLTHSILFAFESEIYQRIFSLENLHANAVVIFVSQPKFREKSFSVCSGKPATATILVYLSATNYSFNEFCNNAIIHRNDNVWLLFWITRKCVSIFFFEITSMLFCSKCRLFSRRVDTVGSATQEITSATFKNLNYFYCFSVKCTIFFLSFC